ncbi:ABC transporter ATP-binding protein [Lawsonia intracellularis]|uniref:Sugar ABC transporter, ATP-binding protein n=1 Tax=Lawsonia intracellularis (strain PHE/MN1-00) TaxID=363253 RepID=Q1MS93_LAWIP|nr:ABC transporter ATP-binding protein [Lawsonia intracellularis]AGC49476.1 ABC transporter ATP-binding protein [Lawsonia intracellularis N343]KAA0204997.1 ABC transporter ATP-binding protein [Lawsonia intracellularis]MBZ3892479.1 ABC transporter ATP-binding protein [Lawsonia intracellularis]OMQ06139.1 ABC transporter ATP-binding protein [Lawsonia intracellularis]RBN32454.1 ABC transporter ATP-binding protein [Lawsonia intracellularis]
MSAICLNNVCKYWDTSKAVDDINFKVESGNLLVLLGPSGCGKTTTLRLIAGLEKVTSGQIIIDDCDVTYLPPSKRHLSMVFQSYALFPHLTVQENILFGLKVRKVPKQEQKKRLDNAVAMLNLYGLLGRKPSMLSGGQQQRVALGRALVANASVCLMDEPLSNLDAQLRNDMRKEIREIQQALKMTMVYVTHDQVEAMSIADQVILMNKGVIVQHAVPEDMYIKPQTIFAASFIGTPPMNIINLSQKDGKLIISGSQDIFIPQVPEGATVIGVRPEHLQISSVGWPSIVLSNEYHGAVSLVTCKVGSEKIIFIQHGNVTCSPGEIVYLSCSPEHMHFFNGDTGNRITRH